MRPLGRVLDDRALRRRVDRVVERDGDVGAERLLDGDRLLRREPVLRAVDVAPEGRAIVIDGPRRRERDDLEAARIGQDRPVPAHEPVEPAEPLDPLVAGAQVQVVGVREDDARADLVEVVGVERLDRRVRADRHELRRLDHAVWQRQPPEARPGSAVRRRWFEDLERGRARDGDGGHVLPTPAPGSSQSGRRSGSARRGGGIS